jgi:endoglucanase Acf2
MDRSIYTEEQNLWIDMYLFGICYKDKATGKRIDPIKVRMKQSDNSYVLLNEDNTISPIDVIAEKYER